MKAGADPNIVNPVLKTTPLHVAARKGNLQILNLVRKYFYCWSYLIGGPEYSFALEDCDMVVT